MRVIFSGIQNLEILKEVRFVREEECSAKYFELYNAFHSFLFRKYGQSNAELYFYSLQLWLLRLMVVIIKWLLYSKFLLSV